MNIPVEKVRDILKIAQEPVSLETPIGEEEDSHLGDFIPDEDASEPSEAASFSLLKEQLMSVLATLTPREEKVLRLRFGIEDGRTRTLTRERIRQMRSSSRHAHPHAREVGSVSARGEGAPPPQPQQEAPRLFELRLLLRRKNHVPTRAKKEK